MVGNSVVTREARYRNSVTLHTYVCTRGVRPGHEQNATPSLWPYMGVGVIAQRCYERRSNIQ